MTLLERLYLALAVDPVTTLGRLTGWIVAVAVLVYAIGCSAPVWPAACPLVETPAGVVRACRCTTWTDRLMPHPTKPRPACQVGYDCDAARLPVTVDAEDCGR